MQELLHCQNVCQQISAGIRGLQTGSVTVGTAYSASYAWISEAASDFHSQYPGIELQIRGGYSTQLLEALRARKVDLCFISEREGDHRWIPLQEDQVMAWIRPRRSWWALRLCGISRPQRSVFLIFC